MCQPAVVCSAGDARHDCFVMGLFFIHWSSHWFTFCSGLFLGLCFMHLCEYVSSRRVCRLTFT
ncbi:hypothetical protein BD769DRAFT_1642634 [Suillus cothurnatus]|nr:hypothetical protein BD769DRAFT_1642634 [Suillus cothurnatus]